MKKQFYIAIVYTILICCFYSKSEELSIGNYNSRSGALNIYLSSGIRIAMNNFSYADGSGYNGITLINHIETSFETSFYKIAPFIGFLFNNSVNPKEYILANQPIYSEHGYLINIGISRPISVGYSNIILCLGGGYNLLRLRVEYKGYNSITKSVNYPVLMAGFKLSLPFLKDIKFIFDYSFLYRNPGTLSGYESGNYYNIDLSKYNNLASMGIMYSFTK